MAPSLCQAAVTRQGPQWRCGEGAGSSHAKTQRGWFPETLLCRMLQSLDEEMISFSKQNKDTALYLEKKCKVAAKPETQTEVRAPCA